MARKKHNRIKAVIAEKDKSSLWLAEQFGLAGNEAEAYAKTVVLSDFEEPGDEDVVRKAMADIAEKGAGIDEAAVRQQMEALIESAKDQVFSEAE